MRFNLTAAVLLVSGAAVLAPTIASAQYYQRYCETRYRNIRIPYQDQVCYGGGYGYGGCKYVTKYRYEQQPYQYCYNKQYYGGGGYGGGGGGY